MSRLGPKALFIFLSFAGAPPWSMATQAQLPRTLATFPEGNQQHAAAAPATVVVSLREVNGSPLDMPAVVKLFSNSMTFHEVAPAEGAAATATFANVAPGDYNVEVTAVGHKKVTEQVSVLSAGTTYPVYVYVPPESEKAAQTPASSVMVMTPKLRGEVEKGVSAMQKRQFGEARAWLAKAAKLAPSNADILYLLGMAEHMLKNLVAAQKEYQAALALQPAHERSLLGLAEVQIQQGDPQGAETTLDKAFRVNGADWRTHLLLAYACFEERKYDQAGAHARQAIALDKTQQAGAQVLLGRIAALQGHADEARNDFQAVIKSFPNDPAAAEAKQRLALLAPAQPAAAGNASEREPVMADLPSVPARGSARPWAPPDIDSKEYPLAPGVACPGSDVLERAQQHMLQRISNFDRFAATEHVVHEEIDDKGVPEELKSKDFWYLVFVQKMEPGGFYLEETRDGDEGVDNFPTALATTGLAGLGVAILQPAYQGDFEFRCEGLSTWRGEAAWQMRFEQKEGVLPRVRVWRKGAEVFPIPLKGRLWISAASYDLLHLETDLREPIRKLHLAKDHLMIDYGPVSFEAGKVRLWLPWKADLYMEVHGKRYHHEHTLTNYELFSVDTTETVGKPKTAAKHAKSPGGN